MRRPMWGGRRVWQASIDALVAPNLLAVPGANDAELLRRRGDVTAGYGAGWLACAVPAILVGVSSYARVSLRSSVMRCDLRTSVEPKEQYLWTTRRLNYARQRAKGGEQGGHSKRSSDLAGGFLHRAIDIRNGKRNGSVRLTSWMEVARAPDHTNIAP
jgi:hypothetical protein